MRLLLYFVLFCIVVALFILLRCAHQLCVCFILSNFVYRYLGGIENEDERSEVVVDLARELTDLGLDPQMFL